MSLSDRESVGLLRSTYDRWFGRSISPLSWDQYQSYFKFDGNWYPYGFQTSYPQSRQEAPDSSFTGYASALYKLNPVLFACALVRLSLFSEARFQFRQLRSGRPGNLFGTEALRILENPWPNATTGDLLARAIQDADVSGNAYFVRRGEYLRRMRPDWVTIVLGSRADASAALEDLELEIVGYLYAVQGSADSEPLVLLPEQVCHFAPIPDPVARFRGMSWLEAITRELMADNAMTHHKLSYFEQGATVNLAVTFDSQLVKTKEQFDAWVETFKRGHEGRANAFKTLFLSGGSKAETIGSTLEEAAFKTVQGAGETRIAAAARTPAVLVGISEGLQGSSLNAGNYTQAARQFADLTMRPLWRNFAGSMAPLIDVPPDAELWYDDRDIPFLKEDVRDAAEILNVQAESIRTLVDGGFDTNSVIDAVTSGDLSLLKHTGALSVQLQEPGKPSGNCAPTANVEA